MGDTRALASPPSFGFEPFYVISINFTRRVERENGAGGQRLAGVEPFSLIALSLRRFLDRPVGYTLQGFLR